MTIQRIEARQQPRSAVAYGLVGRIPAGGSQGLHDDPSAGASETSLAVLVSGAAKDNLFHSMFRSRWLADLKLIDAWLKLSLQPFERLCLLDYRDLLLTALDWGEGGTPANRERGVVRCFLIGIRECREQDICDIVGRLRTLGLGLAERQKLANAMALFRSLPPARSLSEALGFTIVMGAVPG
jgi:hypothetical protein